MREKQTGCNKVPCEQEEESPKPHTENKKEKKKRGEKKVIK